MLFAGSRHIEAGGWLLPVLAMVSSLLAPGAASALDCQRDAEGSPTKLCIQFKMEGGMIVAGEHALSPPSPAMRTRLKEMPLSQLEPFALKLVADQLKLAEKPYPGVPSLANLTGSWQRFVEILTPLAADGTAGTEPLDPRDEMGVLRKLLQLSTDTGVHFMDEAWDLQTGLAQFEILDPFDSQSVQIVFSPDLAPARKANRTRDLRRELANFDGKLWCGACYKAPIESYYSLRELPAQVSPGRAENNVITVVEGKRIANVDLSSVEAGDAEKVAWAVLNTRDFGKWRKLPNRETPGVIDFEKDLQYPRLELPYLVQSQLELQQLSLSQIGYAFDKPQDLTDLTVKLTISSTKQKPEEDAPKPARPDVDPQTGIAGPQRSAAEQLPGADLKPNAEAAPGQITRYFAPGIEYRPGEALRGFVTGELQNLPKPWPSTITFTGGYPFGTLGSINASSDYVGMGTIHMPLSLSARASSTRTLHRFLNGVKQDELRSGPAGRAELELFRDRDGSLLRLYGEMQHTTVGLSGPDGKELGKANLNVVEIGGLYWYHAADKELPTWIVARPQVRAGAGLAQNEPTYATARVDVEVWQAYRQGFGSFVAVHAGVASQATPVFEAISFGGSDSVRGFRSDDAIGRRAWSVQSEARIPLSFHAPAASGGQQSSLSSILSQLKLAPLFDIGGAYSTIGSVPGMRTGAGLGLRVKLSFVEFGLDWAYATSGDAATGGSRGKFYFAIKTILPY